MVILVPFVLFGFRSTIAVFLSAKDMQSSSVFSFLIFFATLGAFPFLSSQSDPIRQSIFLILKCIVLLLPLPSVVFGVSAQGRRVEMSLFLDRSASCTPSLRSAPSSRATLPTFRSGCCFTMFVWMIIITR